jgi:hypothetical protein
MACSGEERTLPGAGFTTARKPIRLIFALKDRRRRNEKDLLLVMCLFTAGFCRRAIRPRLAGPRR